MVKDLNPRLALELPGVNVATHIGRQVLAREHLLAVLHLGLILEIRLEDPTVLSVTGRILEGLPRWIVRADIHARHLAVARRLVRQKPLRCVPSVDVPRVLGSELRVRLPSALVDVPSRPPTPIRRRDVVLHGRVANYLLGAVVTLQRPSRRVLPGCLDNVVVLDRSEI